MNLTTKTLIFLLLFIEFSSLAQTFNDTIFTKTNDTILCQITLVNDQNIFYQYKKKRRTKAANIPLDQVLSYSSENPKLLEIINRPRFPKCDTCENWAVLHTGDTIFYDLLISFIDEEPESHKIVNKHHIIQKVQIITNNSSSSFDLEDINSISWNDLEYKSISLNIDEFKSLHTISNAIHIYGESFLTHQILEGKHPLYAISFKRGDHIPVPTPPFTAILKKVTYRYYTIVNGKKIFIPNGEIKLEDFLRRTFASNQDIIDLLKHNTIRYHEVDKVFKLANVK